MFGHKMEPVLPPSDESLEDLARAVMGASAGLADRFPLVTLNGVRSLLRIVNSYYSNLIEGNSTHPIDIEKAIRKDYSADPAKRNRQIESKIHITVQEEIDQRLSKEPGLNVASPEFLRWVHRIFYEKMPPELHWVSGFDGKRELVVAGHFRSRAVKVGDHIPPDAEEIDLLARYFALRYNPDNYHGVSPLVALAASHHRLMWIHPFLDGNGRVARLFTDAYFVRSGITGYGLWNVSRGLARSREDYRRYLADADERRLGDFDGRGTLSERRLKVFCKFFLEVCLDQAKYMSGLLKLHDFTWRLEKYVRLRNDGLAPSPSGSEETLRLEVAAVLKAAAIEGEIGRGEAVRLIGMSERAGRDVLKGLIKEGLLVSDSPKGAVRLGFPAHSAGYWFPDIYPGEA
jgi:Fic family protein